MPHQHNERSQGGLNTDLYKIMCLGKIFLINSRRSAELDNDKFIWPVKAIKPHYL